MFLTKDNKILINELAPRPHNSGHWTMDSCKFSQFDNLISLITKGKIYSPEPSKNCKMINIIGDDYSNINVIKRASNAMIIIRRRSGLQERWGIIWILDKK